jgi:hypothetical protein
MSDYGKMPYARRETTANSKPLGSIEINGQSREYYIPISGVPDLYIEGIGEPIIKVEVDFTPGQGWRATDLLESPKYQDEIGQITASGQYKYYAEEVASYIRHLNQTRPNG